MTADQLANLRREAVDAIANHPNDPDLNVVAVPCADLLWLIDCIAAEKAAHRHAIEQQRAAFAKTLGEAAINNAGDYAHRMEAERDAIESARVLRLNVIALMSEVAEAHEDAESLRASLTETTESLTAERARTESEGTAERMGACSLLRTVRDEHTNAAKMWQDYPVEQQRYATVATVLHNAAMAIEKGAHRRTP